jgi:leucyl aminopeptidase
MKISLYTDDLFDAPVELIAVGVFSDEPDRGLAFSHLNRRLYGALEQSCRDEDFQGKPGQSVLYNVPPGRAVRRIMVAGLGERDAYDAEKARHLAGAATRMALRVGAHGAAIQLPILEVPTPTENVLAGVQAMTEGARLGAYRFDAYRTRDTKQSPLEEVRIAFVAEDVQGTRGADLRSALRRGEAAAEGVAWARDLINEPPNALTPVEIAERAKKMAKAEGLAIKTLAPRDLERQGMYLHLGVAQGSRQEPRLVHLTYEPEDKAKAEEGPVLALVGKGLTFDAGGLSLKTSEGMTEMKIDMGGAAAVLGAMKAIARLKPAITVHGLVGAAENMPDGNAIRPGDVLKSKKGLTVEVLNTDAEGRLVLADVLAYAQELDPSHLVDLATLTGAALVSLGRQRAAAYYDDGVMREALEAAYRRSGELYWRMPLAPELREVLESDIADLKNVGNRFGGSITAALFLRDFVARDLPWAHLDIAGPVWATSDSGYVAKGGTGYGVRTLVELVTVLEAAEESEA